VLGVHRTQWRCGPSSHPDSTVIVHDIALYIDGDRVDYRQDNGRCISRVARCPVFDRTRRTVRFLAICPVKNMMLNRTNN